MCLGSVFENLFNIIELNTDEWIEVDMYTPDCLVVILSHDIISFFIYVTFYRGRFVSSPPSKDACGSKAKQFLSVD